MWVWIQMTEQDWGNGWDLEMLRDKRSVGTWERSITESEVKNYVRVRLELFAEVSLCKVIPWKIIKVL